MKRIALVLALLAASVAVSFGQTLPKTWVASEVIRASDLNGNFTYLNDNLFSLDEDNFSSGFVLPVSMIENGGLLASHVTRHLIGGTDAFTASMTIAVNTQGSHTGPVTGAITVTGGNAVTTTQLSSEISSLSASLATIKFASNSGSTAMISVPFTQDVASITLSGSAPTGVYEVGARVWSIAYTAGSTYPPLAVTIYQNATPLESIAVRGGEVAAPGTQSDLTTHYMSYYTLGAGNVIKATAISGSGSGSYTVSIGLTVRYLGASVAAP